MSTIKQRTTQQSRNSLYSALQHIATTYTGSNKNLQLLSLILSFPFDEALENGIFSYLTGQKFPATRVMLLQVIFQSCS